MQSAIVVKYVAEVELSWRQKNFKMIDIFYQPELLLPFNA